MGNLSKSLQKKYKNKKEELTDPEKDLLGRYAFYTLRSGNLFKKENKFQFLDSLTNYLCSHGHKKDFEYLNSMRMPRQNTECEPIRRKDPKSSLDYLEGYFDGLGAKK